MWGIDLLRHDETSIRQQNHRCTVPLFSSSNCSDKRYIHALWYPSLCGAIEDHRLFATVICQHEWLYFVTLAFVFAEVLFGHLDGTAKIFILHRNKFTYYLQVTKTYFYFSCQTGVVGFSRRWAKFHVFLIMRKWSFSDKKAAPWCLFPNHLLKDKSVRFNAQYPKSKKEFLPWHCLTPGHSFSLLHCLRATHHDPALFKLTFLSVPLSSRRRVS